MVYPLKIKMRDNNDFNTSEIISPIETHFQESLDNQIDDTISTMLDILLFAIKDLGIAFLPHSPAYTFWLLVITPKEISHCYCELNSSPISADFSKICLCITCLKLTNC